MFALFTKVSGFNSGVIEKPEYLHFGVPEWPASKGEIVSETDIQCASDDTRPEKIWWGV